jgi:two-component system response regulator HydG
MERAVVLCRDDRVGLDDLPPELRQARGGRKLLSFEVGTPLKNVERRMIEETMRANGGDRNLTASLLGITARTIYRREAEWASEDESD